MTTGASTHALRGKTSTYAYREKRKQAANMHKSGHMWCQNMYREKRRGAQVLEPVQKDRREVGYACMRIARGATSGVKNINGSIRKVNWTK